MGSLDLAHRHELAAILCEPVAVNGGLIEGPRIFCAGRALTPYGGIFDNSGPSNPAGTDDSVGIVTVHDGRHRTACSSRGISREHYMRWPIC